MNYITLSNGVKIPQLGLGTFLMEDPKECEQVIIDAIKIGYRLIDTAELYNNEEYVGNAIKNCGVPREELFITTKLDYARYDDAEQALLESFEKLQLDYIDLVLIHWPYSNYYHAYRVLEKYYKMGKIRAIGVSNFEPGRLIDLINFNEIKPHVNQIEAHLYNQRKEERKWYAKYGVDLEAYGPLGRGRIDGFLENPILVELANKYNKTTAQVAMRFLLQEGFIVIPKSNKINRLKENIDLFDFNLNDEEMDKLREQDQKIILTGESDNPVRTEKMMAAMKK